MTSSIQSTQRLVRRPAPNRKLRVLSLAHSAVNRLSGRVRYERLAEMRDDIDLTLVAPDRWQEYGKAMPLDPHTGPMDFRVSKIRLPYVPRVGWYLHHYPRLDQLLKETAPDVIHLWEEPWSLVGLHALRLRDKKRSEAAVLLETDQNIKRSLPPPFEQIRRYALARIDHLIGRQPESLEVARQCGYAGATTIVEYGVASDVFTRARRPAAQLSDGFVIGYVGRIVAEKGLFDVLDAMASSLVPVTFVVLGAGPAKQALLDRAAALGLSARLQILDPCAPEGVAWAMNGFDVLVLMSRTGRTWKEQFGRVIMEAHSCGVPVIGSDSGAIPGVVAGGGWIVPEGDVDRLARLIEYLASNPGEVLRAGLVGHDQARTRFSMSTVANALADSFHRAADTRRSTRERHVQDSIYA